MDEPIISPWIIYAIDICNSIKGVTIFFSVLGVFAIIGIFIGMFIGENLDDKPYINSMVYRKLLKKLMIFTTAFIIVAIIIPDKRVGYTMLATRYVTKENVLKAVEITDKIANKIIQIKGDNTADYGNKEK